MTTSESPFLRLPSTAWVAANDLAFAIRDGFPVSPGHSLVIPRRLVACWLDTTVHEQHAVLDLVREVRVQLDRELRPAGFNIGVNDGPAAGQTVMHVHWHVIPRYVGDVADPRGGIRWVIPALAAYWERTT